MPTEARFVGNRAKEINGGIRSLVRKSGTTLVPSPDREFSRLALERALLRGHVFRGTSPGKMRLAILSGIPAVVGVAGISKQAEINCERKFDMNTPGVEDLLAALTAEPG